jgi:hypothetical protein
VRDVPRQPDRFPDPGGEYLATDGNPGDAFQHHQMFIFVSVTMQRRRIAGLGGDLDRRIDTAGLAGRHTYKASLTGAGLEPAIRIIGMHGRSLPGIIQRIAAPGQAGCLKS